MEKEAGKGVIVLNKKTGRHGQQRTAISKVITPGELSSTEKNKVPIIIRDMQFTLRKY